MVKLVIADVNLVIPGSIGSYESSTQLLKPEKNKDGINNEFLQDYNLAFSIY